MKIIVSKQAPPIQHKGGVRVWSIIYHPLANFITDCDVTDHILGDYVPDS